MEEDQLSGLTDQQKEDTLNLMQIAAIDKTNVARHYMEMCNFDMNAAMSMYLETGASGGGNHDFEQEEHKQQNAPPPPPQQQFNSDLDHQAIQNMQQQMAYDMFQQASNAENNNQVPGVDNAQLEKYKQYLKNKKILEQNNGVVKKVFTGIGSASKSIWNSVIPVGFRGETAGGEEFIHFISKKLKIKESLNFQYGGFQENLDKASAQKRPVLIFIYQDSCPSKQLQLELLVNQEIKDVARAFHVIGILNTSEEAQKLLKTLKSDKWPAFAVYRKNLFEQNELIQATPVSIQVSDPKFYVTKLKEARAAFYMKMSEDDKIQKAEKQQNRPSHNPFMMGEMQYYQMQQNQSFQNTEQYRQEQTENQRRLAEEKRIKAQQEKEYQEMLQQSEIEAQQKAEEERIKHEQEVAAIIAEQLKEEELKKKKQEIKSEPAEGTENIISIVFRLPDGKKMQRRFMLADTVQNVFDFIETNDEVVFESKERQFNLIQTHPPLNLSEKLEQTLDAVFDGSDFEQLHVREL